MLIFFLINMLTWSNDDATSIFFEIQPIKYLNFAHVLPAKRQILISGSISMQLARLHQTQRKRRRKKSSN